MEFEFDNTYISYTDGFKETISDIVIDCSTITCIMGRNGSGKSTLLKAMTRMIPLSSGRILLDGRDISSFSRKEFARKVAVLEQHHNDVPDLYVIDLLRLGRFPYRSMLSSFSQHDEDVIDEAIVFTSIENLVYRNMRTLSGGEAQRVWLALALVQEPEILMLDEPSTHLDVKFQLELLSLLRKLNEINGIGIIAILHDISHALWLDRNVILMKDGLVYTHGKSKEVLTMESIKDVYDVDCVIGMGLPDHLPAISYSSIHI